MVGIETGFGVGQSCDNLGKREGGLDQSGGRSGWILDILKVSPPGLPDGLVLGSITFLILSTLLLFKSTK